MRPNNFGAAPRVTTASIYPPHLLDFVQHRVTGEYSVYYSLAKVGFDKAENEPSKVFYNGLTSYYYTAWILYLQPNIPH